MELCTPQTFSKLPNQWLPQWKPYKFLKFRFNSGLPFRTGSSIRSTSEEPSSFTRQYVKDEPVSFATVENTRKAKETEAYELYVPPTVEKKDDGAVQNETPIEDSVDDKKTDAYESLIYEPPKVEEKDDGALQSEAPVEDSSLDFQAQLSEFFDKLNIKFDPEDSSSIALLGAVIALWLTTSIVGTIDSIPLFPKLLEVVGLGYTVWFSTRYLIFKKNRDELAAKIEELKQEVLGSNSD